MLRTQERALHVHAEHRLHVLGSPDAHWAYGRLDASVVEEVVEAAELLEGGVDE